MINYQRSQPKSMSAGERLSEAATKREGRRGNETESDGRWWSEREWEWETEREGIRVTERDGIRVRVRERDWEWEGMRVRLWVCFESFLSAICRTRGGPKINQVQWTRFQCTKTESRYVQKSSLSNSVSMCKNRVQWTRFLGVRGHFVHLSYWKNRKLEYNILDL